MNGPNGHPAMIVAPMEKADIPQVVEIDRLSFPLPWSATSYAYELTENKASHFIVAIVPMLQSGPNLFTRLLGRSPVRKVIGYAGFWFVVDEAHIGAIAIHPDWRGHGLGEQLLVALLQRALDLQAVTVTLEVRVGNHVAQNLYRKYGFEEVGQRRGYYRDNREDALLMTARVDEAYRAKILERHNTLVAQEKT